MIKRLIYRLFGPRYPWHFWPPDTLYVKFRKVAERHFVPEFAILPDDDAVAFIRADDAVAEIRRLKKLIPPEA